MQILDNIGSYCARVKTWDKDSLRDVIDFRKKTNQILFKNIIGSDAFKKIKKETRVTDLFL